MVLSGAPVTPDRDEAREWAERELSRPEYAAAQPTPLDRIAQAVRDFFASIFGGEAPAGLGSVVLIVLAVLVVALIVTAFAIWGRPRAVHRAAAPFAPLFGDDDDRSSTQLRALAQSRADAGDWADAIVLRTRALARALQERELVDLPPGATVHAFARATARVFPDARAAVDVAADGFDDVRYLRRPGTREGYEQIARTDERIAAMRATPRLAAAGPVR